VHENLFEPGYLSRKLDTPSLSSTTIIKVP